MTFVIVRSATVRSAYILEILKSAGPAFGTEWQHQRGNVLLRVSVILSPVSTTNDGLGRRFLLTTLGRPETQKGRCRRGDYMRANLAFTIR